jgi:UDP-GlcNAc:undecaprenyl-phosphate/decaprenyl-phosphate GlcNAc-1-phosphate transferase
MTSKRAALRLLMAAAGARAAYESLTRAQPGGEKTWTRTNHRGEPVTLLEGPAATIGAAGAALAVPGLDARTRLAMALAGAGAGAVGCYDDLAGSSDRHGFRGHLAALTRGEVTTGSVKIAGIGAAASAASFLLDCRDNGMGASTAGGAAGSGQKPPPLARLADLVINTGLVAGSANLLNLFDLRPGRAVKVALLASAALSVRGPEARAEAAAPAGAAAALLTDDLSERAMLGDCGANALGAMIGLAAASSLRRPARLAILGGLAALTAASEKVSFTKVIAKTPALNWLDMLGRRPAAQVPAREMGPEGGLALDGDADRTATAAKNSGPL